jgi:hypothetical protein
MMRHVLNSVSRLSKAFAMKGTIEQFLTLRLSESYCIELFLAFVTVKIVVASVAAGVEDSGSRGVCTNEPVTGAGSSSTKDPSVHVEASQAHGASVLDIALVLGCAGTVDRDVVCGLLMECLQDVSSNALVLRIFVTCYLVINSQLFLRYVISLMKAVEKIIAEDSGETLCKCVVELESENSKLKATIAESTEDYEVLQLGSASLLAERNNLRYRCEDLEAKLVNVHSKSAANIASLEAKIQSTEAHTVEVAAASKKHLSDFEAELVRDLAGLQKLYIHNI